MLFKSISCIFLLIPISTAKIRFTIQCEGELTILSCLDSNNHIDFLVEKNVLWKKGSGERVIWNYNGERERGDSYKNRNIKMHDNVSLSIDGCDKSDEGIYILCINGKPSCEIRLFVKDSKECTKPNTSTEQSTGSPEFSTWAKEAHEKQQQTKTSLENAKSRWTVLFSPCIFGIVVLFLFVNVWTQKEETCKNSKSGTKLLQTEAQSNSASAQVEI